MLGKNYEMANTYIPESKEKLMEERETAVRRLGEVAIKLSNANFEYNETIIEIISINKMIGEHNGEAST